MSISKHGIKKNTLFKLQFNHCPPFEDVEVTQPQGNE